MWYMAAFPASRACCELFFFFQAEDGIRDYKVTGVQTCALPILVQDVLHEHERVGPGRLDQEDARLRVLRAEALQAESQLLARGDPLGLIDDEGDQIGRASCRERV